MTGLRTIWGVSLDRIDRIGMEYLNYLNKQFVSSLMMIFIENNILKPTAKGKFLTDGIASDLFYLNLKSNVTAKVKSFTKLKGILCRSV
jgi:oxygen-independent coproporphyrinogen-3 oxidase